MKTQYRNVFAEIGIEQAQIKARLEEIRDFYFYGKEDERVYYPVGDDMAYIMDTGNNDARTEGMSYGMMICVQLDMHEEFDRLWKWAKTYMWMADGFHEGYFAWSCATDGTKNADSPAPDGEEFFAMALFFASNRWGDGEGIFNYSHEAREILRACLHKGENGRAGVPMWNRDNYQILFVPGVDCSRCGRMRRTGHSGSVRRSRAVGIWRRHVMRRPDFLRSTPSLTEARFAGSCHGRRIGTTGSTVTRTARWQISDWTMSGSERMRDSAMRRRRSRRFCLRPAEKIHTTSMRQTGA